MKRLIKATWLVLIVAMGTSNFMIQAQVPFDLDPSFEFSGVDETAVISAFPTPDGGVILSGDMSVPAFANDKLLLKLLSDGSVDPLFAATVLGMGKITPWNGLYYVGTAQTVRRILPDGNLDPSFIGMNMDPYFSSLQGGDYHVYPDGRILMSGLHLLSDSARGFVGPYNMIWFTNTGQLDTTRTHRTSNGRIYEFEQQPDGKFLCSGTMTEYEGTPVPSVFRIHPDGALDTTFNAPIYWELAATFHTLQDGKILVGGGFKFNMNAADTLGLVRLYPDGSLDSAFHLLDFKRTYSPNSISRVLSIFPLDPSRYIITGAFDQVEGQVRGGICLIDTAGNLLNDYFTGAGCGGWQNGGSIRKYIAGITEAPDGSYYIYGSYHGYDDGTTNDPGQRMVSRLYGLDVGVQETGDAPETLLHVHPNPANDRVMVTLPADIPESRLDIYDAQGRYMTTQLLKPGMPFLELNVREWAPGLYLGTLQRDGVRLGEVKFNIVR